MTSCSSISNEEETLEIPGMSFWRFLCSAGFFLMVKNLFLRMLFCGDTKTSQKLRRYTYFLMSSCHSQREAPGNSLKPFSGRFLSGGDPSGATFLTGLQLWLTEAPNTTAFLQHSIIDGLRLYGYSQISPGYFSFFEKKNLLFFWF